MRLLGPVVFFAAALSVSASSWAEGPDCAAKFQLAQAKMTEDDYLQLVQDDTVLATDTNVDLVEDKAELMGEEAEEELLIGLVIPSMYTKHQAEYEASRKHAREVLLPLVAKLRQRLADLGGNLTFVERINLLGLQWDDISSDSERKAILIQLTKMFSISQEIHYMNLIAKGEQSLEFKIALNEVLMKIFRNDPTWVNPLKNAMSQARAKAAAKK